MNYLISIEKPSMQSNCMLYDVTGDDTIGDAMKLLMCNRETKLGKVEESGV